MSWLDLALTLAALPVTAASLYLATLAAFARKNAPLPCHAPRVKFDIVIPAHNEEAGIATTIDSVLALDYPRHLYRVFVIADNCSDSTALRATSAGSHVLTRNAPHARGKGYALAYGFEHILRDPFADVVVTIDADTLVSRNFLSAISARFEGGALATQADYGVRNPG